MIEELTSNVELDTVLTVIQILALTLPALAIFFQIGLSVSQDGQSPEFMRYILTRIMKWTVILFVISSMTIFGLFILLSNNLLLNVSVASLFIALLFLIPVVYFTGNVAEEQYKEYLDNELKEEVEQTKDDLVSMRNDVLELKNDISDIQNLDELEKIEEDEIDDELAESLKEADDVEETLESTEDDLDKQIKKIEETNEMIDTLYPDSMGVVQGNFKQLRKDPKEYVKKNTSLILYFVTLVSISVSGSIFDIPGRVTSFLYMLLLSVFMILVFRN